MIKNYLIAFVLVQICLVPALAVFGVWTKKYTDYRRQYRMLITMLIISIITPVVFLVPLQLPAHYIDFADGQSAVADDLSGTSTAAGELKDSRVYGGINGSKTVSQAGSIGIYRYFRKIMDKIFPLIALCLIVGILKLLSIFIRHMLRISNIQTAGECESVKVNNAFYPVCRSAAVRVPFSTGIIRPKIYLPVSDEAGVDDPVLMHEAFHIRNKHIQLIWLFEIYAALLWFVPAAAYMKKQNARLIELMTDEEVCSQYKSVHYAELLYKYARMLPGERIREIAVSAVSGKFLKERITQIMGGAKRSPSKLAGSGFATGLVSFVVFIIYFLSCSPPVETVTADDISSAGERLKDSSEMVISDEEDRKVPVALMWPLESGAGRITLPYGQTDAISGLKNGPWFHYGTDIAALSGTPVLSTADGFVSDCGYAAETYGNYIIIGHDNGLTTVYSHLRDIAVEVNEKVGRGAVIGLLGNTGRSTGPHLHFAVSETPVLFSSEQKFENAVFVDPQEYISR